MTLAQLLALSLACAPSTAPETLLSVVRVESGFDPLAIGVNSQPRRMLHPANPGEAAATTMRLAAAGADFDVGLGQINRRNLRALGLTAQAAFDPCRNLAAAARVLAAGYAPPDEGGDVQPAIERALSRYNTGSPFRGVANGYVARVKAAARVIVPALSPDQAPPPDIAGSRPRGRPAPPPWDVFADPGARARLVFDREPSGDPPPAFPNTPASGDHDAATPAD